MKSAKCYVAKAILVGPEITGRVFEVIFQCIAWPIVVGGGLAVAYMWGYIIIFGIIPWLIEHIFPVVSVFVAVFLGSYLWIISFEWLSKKIKQITAWAKIQNAVCEENSSLNFAGK